MTFRLSDRRPVWYVIGAIALLLSFSASAAAQFYPSSKHGGNYMFNFYFPPAPSSTPWAPSWSPDGKWIAVAMSGSIWKVDPETGKTTISRFTVFQDAGKAIHPSYVEGQMQGGSAQGIGWALNEEYYMDSSGSMDNSTLLDYRMPTALDLPMIETVIVEVPSESHPYGVRGVGEANIVPPMAAIANALNEAVGIRFEHLPMKPEVIVKAIQNKSE